MVVALFLTLVLGATTGETLPDGIEISCKFDSPTIRLGDFAYCEVRVQNRSDVVRKIETPWSTLWFEVRPVEELRASDEVHGWDVGGGGHGGGTTILLPSEYVVAWKRVPLFRAESLHELRDRPTIQQLRVRLMYYPVVVRYPVATLPIRGNISKHPGEVDLVSKLYVPYKEHPDVPDAWRDLKNITPTFSNSIGTDQMPWMYNTPRGLAELREQLDEKSAMYRAVRILQAQQAVTFARPEDKKKAMEQVFTELQRCGPAEREWYRRGEIQSAFHRARDFESAKLFGEIKRESLWPYERYTADGRLEPVTADEGRYGRRPGVSTPD